jgi:hypothetical protein
MLVGGRSWDLIWTVRSANGLPSRVTWPRIVPVPGTIVVIDLSVQSSPHDRANSVRHAPPSTSSNPVQRAELGITSSFAWNVVRT